MLWTIVRKELLSNLVSFRFVLIFLLCCTLILVSAYTMRDKYNDRVAEYSAAVKMHRQELTETEGQQAINQLVLSGYKLDKPPTPLSVIVEGMEGAAGKFATVSVFSTPSLDGGAGSDPVFAYFGTLDVMYVVRVVLSLVAILLTYDTISGEREEGTLKLALSNSVPRHAILLSKFIGSYVTLLLPFLVPVLIALLILTTSGSIDFSGEDWSRLGLILLASLLYIGVFLMLGLLVSGRTNRSTTALMMLLFVWVVIVLAVPKVSMVVAGKLREVPSAQVVQAEKDAAMTQVLAEGQEEIQEFVRERGQEMSSEERGAEIARLQEEMFTDLSKEQGEIQEKYDREKTAQFLLAANISRISPASVYTYAAIDLARTGFDRQERFLAAARSYQVGFVQYFNEVLQNMRGKKTAETKIDVDGLPTLEFRESSLSESWREVSMDVLILFLLMACFFMIAYIGFVRSDIR